MSAFDEVHFTKKIHENINHLVKIFEIISCSKIQFSSNWFILLFA